MAYPTPLPTDDFGQLTNALGSYNDQQLWSIINAAKEVIAKRKRAYAQDPPERYWHDVTHRCGHTQRVLIPMENAAWAAKVHKELNEMNCLPCAARSLNEMFPELLWHPEPLEGVSVKQREFGDKCRLRLVNGFVHYLKEDKPLVELVELEKLSSWLDIISANWWIERRETQGVFFIFSPERFAEIEAYYELEGGLSARQRGIRRRVEGS